MGTPVLSGCDLQELDELIAKGITGTGEGFDAPSMGRLGAGGFGGHNPSPALLRIKMLEVISTYSNTLMSKVTRLQSIATSAPLAAEIFCRVAGPPLIFCCAWFPGC